MENIAVWVADNVIGKELLHQIISSILYEDDFTEEIKLAIFEAVLAAEHNGSPKPIFETDEDRTYFLVRLPVHEEFHESEIRDVEVHQVTDQVMRLLKTLSEGDLGVKSLLSCLSLSHRPTFMQNYLQPALEAKLVEMTQPDSPRSPTQKYRLTKQGSAYLQQINKEKA